MNIDSWQDEHFEFELNELLLTVLLKYPQHTQTPPPGTDSAMRALIEHQVPNRVLEMLLREHIRHFMVVGSVGKGAWSQVPWVAILDPRRTLAPSHGTYAVYLFAADGNAVYLTLNQGTGGLQRGVYMREHQLTRSKYLAAVPSPLNSFNKGPLATGALKSSDANRGRAYEQACIFWRRYARQDLASISTAELARDLTYVITLYRSVAV